MSVSFYIIPVAKVRCTIARGTYDPTYNTMLKKVVFYKVHFNFMTIKLDQSSR